MMYCDNHEEMQRMIREIHECIAGGLNKSGLRNDMSQLVESLDLTTQSVARLKKTVYGNGEQGLDERMRTIERSQSFLSSWIGKMVYILAGAAVGSASSRLLFWLSIGGE